jgi:hypothetical protein
MKETGPRVESERKPPLEWFQGMWAFNRLNLFFSDALNGLGGGEVGKALLDVLHLNRMVVDGKLEGAVPPERAEKIAEAERVVFQATGFTPEELIVWKVKIADHFKGKTQEETRNDTVFPLEIEWPPAG